MFLSVFWCCCLQAFDELRGEWGPLPRMPQPRTDAVAVVAAWDGAEPLSTRSWTEVTL